MKPQETYKYTSPDFTNSKIDPDDPFKFRRIIDPDKFPARAPLTEEELESISPKQDISNAKKIGARSIF